MGSLGSESIVVCMKSPVGDVKGRSLNQEGSPYIIESALGGWVDS